MAPTLLQKQWKFSRLVPVLIAKCHELGYEVIGFDWHRSAKMANEYAKTGKGIKHSLHCLCLAFDLNLYKDGVLLEFSEQYQAIGEFWESLSTDEYRLCWGGRFHDPDGCHFSMEHNGIR